MSESTPVTEVTLVDEPAKQLATLVTSTRLEAQSAQSVLASFEPLLKQADEWKAKVALIKVTDVSQKREMALARETRLGLRELRITAEKTRKALKEDSLRLGKAIDGAYNIVEFLIAPLEKTLLDQEKFAENKEIERKAALKRERLDAIILYVPNAAHLAGYVLEDMTPESFDLLLASAKTQHETRIEEARKAEDARIAAVAEQERIRLENERLKKEAAERDAAAKVERERVEKEKAEAEQKAKDELARRTAVHDARVKLISPYLSLVPAPLEYADMPEERFVIVLQDKKLQADERTKQAKEAADRAEATKKEHERLEAEKAELKRKADAAAAEAKALQDKIDAENKAREEAAKKERAAARKAARAPDRDKLKAFAESLRKLQVPQVPDISNQIEQGLVELAGFVDELAESLK